jgi:hypothetical protein
MKTSKLKYYNSIIIIIVLYSKRYHLKIYDLNVKRSRTEDIFF